MSRRAVGLFVLLLSTSVSTSVSTSAAWAQSGAATSPGLVPQIATNGIGEISLPPDRARLVFSVETSGPDAVAVRSARAQAETMAQAAGGRLGELIELRSSGPGPRPVAFEARALAAGAETPISRSEISVSEQVSARWRFVAP